MAFLQDSTTTRPVVPSPASVGVVALARIRRAWTRRVHRHEVEGMLTLDAHILADMGIDRDDVREALTHRDPSVHLSRAAARRRFRR